MKKNLFLFLILVASASMAQPVRLHLMGGFANYSGDIKQGMFTLKQANAVVSAGGTFSITKQLALRSDYSFTKLQADDKFNKAGLKARNLNFKTIIQELTLMAEYDILDLNEHRWSPYVFAGAGVFHFSPYTVDSSGNKAYLVGLSTEGQGLPEYPERKVYRTNQLNIPYGAGIKYALSDDLFIGFEIGFRKLFTDYLDDVSTTYVDPNVLLNRKGVQAAEFAFRGDELKPPVPFPGAGAMRGNSKKNDYYYYGQFRISFRMPWFDKGENTAERTSRRGLGCPSWHL
jgi:opacity protein-like surface antigen